MGTPIVDLNAELVKITHINNTRAVLQANLKPCQFGWETDYHYLSFKDEGGTYHSISPSGNLVHNHDDRYYTETEMSTLLSAKESVANKGVANGYASLDNAGKVPVTQLPNSIMEYKGSWNASTNTPTLATGVGNTGDVYRVSVAGSQFGISFVAGDYCIYNGSTWEKSDATDAVTSVDGYQGAVTLAGKYVSIAGDESITGAKTFTQNTTFGGRIIGSASDGAWLYSNTATTTKSKAAVLGYPNTNSGGYVVVNENNTDSRPGDVVLQAGSGDGTTAGAISISPRMYLGERPANDYRWGLALGPYDTFYSDGSGLNIMHNLYFDGADWRYRSGSGNNSGGFIVTTAHNQFSVKTATDGIKDNVAILNTAIHSNTIGNTALGKATFISSNNRLEVEGNTYINGVLVIGDITNGSNEMSVTAMRVNQSKRCLGNWTTVIVPSGTTIYSVDMNDYPGVNRFFIVASGGARTVKFVNATVGDELFIRVSSIDFLVDIAGGGGTLWRRASEFSTAVGGCYHVTCESVASAEGEAANRLVIY